MTIKEAVVEETVIKYAREIIPYLSNSDQLLSNLGEVHCRLCWIGGYLSVIFPDTETASPSHAFIESGTLHIAWTPCVFQNDNVAEFGSHIFTVDLDSSETQSRLADILHKLQSDLNILVGALVRTSQSNPSTWVTMHLKAVMEKYGADAPSTISRWKDDSTIPVKQAPDHRGYYLVDVESELLKAREAEVMRLRNRLG